MSEEDKKTITKQRVGDIAMYESLKYSVTTAVVVGAATVFASYKNKNFNQLMSLSAKMSLPVMASIGVFAYKYETVQYDAIHNPGRWGLEKPAVEKKIVTKMPLHHRAMNYLYDHPFYFVSGLGFPLAGYILKQQMKNPNLSLSQKVMHSRVYAQGGVLAILMTTMAFTAYMDKRGRFPEPGEAAPALEEETVNFGVGSADHARKRT